jgi:hypothetical protein
VRVSLVHNEKTKLLAAAVDRAATASLTVGVLGPIAAAFYNVPGFSAGLWPTVVGTACWLLLAFILHLEAQRILRRLVE